ncbi:MAG: hypothetical protein R3D32_01230 [Nitratireductor sp.]
MARNADVYYAHFLKFGKITDSEDGPIAGNPSERITSHSRDIPRGLRLTTSPSSVIPDRAVRRDDLAIGARDTGALFIREPEQGNPALVARIRFPSEAGKDQGGRHYTQMTAAFVPQADWQSFAPAILLAGFDNLRAKSDTLDDISANGELRPQLPLATRSPQPLSIDDLSALWIAFNALASTGSFRADSNHFHDERGFFAMLSLLVQLRPLQIASDYRLVFATGIKSGSRIADISFSEGETEAPDARIQGTQDFAKTFVKPSNWNALRQECSRNHWNGVIGDRKENIRRQFSQIIEYCRGVMYPQVERAVHSGGQQPVVARRTAQPPQEQRINALSGKRQMHDHGIYMQDRNGRPVPRNLQTSPVADTSDLPAPAMFNEASGIPVLEAVAEWARNIPRTSTEPVSHGTRVQVPTLDQVARAASGQRVELQSGSSAAHGHYWISTSQEGLRQFDGWLREPGIGDPGLREALERFASCYQLLFGDELDRLKRYHRIAELLRKRIGPRFDDMLTRSMEIEKVSQTSRQRWARFVFECLACRLENGVQLPRPELVRTAFESLPYQATDYVARLNVALKSAHPAPGSLPSDIRSFNIDRSRMAEIIVPARQHVGGF